MEFVEFVYLALQVVATLIAAAACFVLSVAVSTALSVFLPIPTDGAKAMEFSMWTGVVVAVAVFGLTVLKIWT